MSKIEPPIQGNDHKNKEPWYTRFIPESVHYSLYKFKTRNEKSNIVLHAEHELAKSLRPEADEMDRLMATQVIELLKLFSTHEHSGFSAPYAISMFSALANYKPLGPLTGEDSEWNEIGEYMGNPSDHTIYQNNRASHVFKHVYDDGTKADYVYDINGKVFREPDGCSYTSGESKVEIQFPYTPHTEYVDVLPTKGYDENTNA